MAKEARRLMNLQTNALIDEIQVLENFAESREAETKKIQQITEKIELSSKETEKNKM
jgi:hypothetical protein